MPPGPRFGEASREEALSLLRNVVLQLQVEQPEWENNTLRRYLGAMLAWLEVCHQAYANAGKPFPADPWALIADAVLAAQFYEDDHTGPDGRFAE